MSTSKQQYIQKLRTETAYPTYRFFVGLIALMLYFIGAFRIFDAVISFFTTEPPAFLRGVITLLITVVLGVMLIVVGKVVKEAMLMLADLVDSVTETNSRHDQQ